MYLWHWPVIVLFTGARTGLSGAGLLVARLALIAALVVASYFLVEVPIRRQWLPRGVRAVLYPLGAVITVAAIFLGTTPSLVVHSRVRRTLIRYAPASVIVGAGGLEGQQPISIGRVIDAAHPLHVVLIGDSMMQLAAPGIKAALEASGDVTAANFGFPGWGTSTIARWRGYVTHAVEVTHADVVMLTTGWDGRVAHDHPAAYRATLTELVRVARAAGAKGVVFLEYPRTHPAFNVTPSSQAATDAAVTAWNAAAAAMPALAPGHAMYFPVAPGVELHGRYSAWIPPPREPNAPRATWDRVRRLDGVHLCAPGITLYAAPIAADASAVWHVPAPPGRWWVNGWQRDPLVAARRAVLPGGPPAVVTRRMFA